MPAVIRWFIGWLSLMVLMIYSAQTNNSAVTL